MNLTQYHIKFGRHSRIPECCIYFFLTTWKLWEIDTLLDRDYRRAMRTLGHNAGYVICPNCLLTNNIQPIHRCYDGCGFIPEHELKIK